MGVVSRAERAIYTAATALVGGGYLAIEHIHDFAVFHAAGAVAVVLMGAAIRLRRMSARAKHAVFSVMVILAGTVSLVSIYWPGTWVHMNAIATIAAMAVNLALLWE